MIPVDPRVAWHYPVALQGAQREERDDPVNPMGMRKRQTPQNSLFVPRCELPAASRKLNKTHTWFIFGLFPPTSTLGPS